MSTPDKHIEALAQAREELCRLVLQRDIEAEALFKTRSKEATARMMRELGALGYAERSDGVWSLTVLGKKKMVEAERRLKARRHEW
jgi:hypothetical protein